MIVTAGATNRSVYFYIVGDASHASPGDPVTGLLFSDIETGGSASYNRSGAARVDLTLVTQTAAGAHTDGGFIEVDATNQPGVYRCDYPDAAFLTGVDQVICQIVVAAANNAVAAPVLVDITDFDTRSANVVVGSTAAGAITATSLAADTITAAKIAVDAIGSDELAATAVTKIMASVIESEGSYTVQQALSIILSACAGVTSASGATLETPNGVANRIVATIVANERTAVTLTPSS